MVQVPLLAIGLSACASAPVASRPAAEFPSQAALKAIEAKPAALPALPQEIDVGAGWAPEGALPEVAGDEAWQPEGAWGAAFSETVSGAERPPRVTRALGCTARELGRFMLEHKAPPPQALRRFMNAACGSVSEVGGYAYVGGEVPPTATDEEVLARWGSRFRERVAEGVKAGAQVVGFSFERRDGRAVASAVFAVEEAQLDPFSPVPDARGEVTIAGRLSRPAGQVTAYVNRGRAGVAPCDVDLSVQRPSFRVICRPDPADRSAWIQLMHTAPKRALATPFAQVLARRAGEAPVYQDEAYAASRPVASAEQFTRAVLEQLNRARAGVGLRPVALAARESATAARLAPHYFAAALGKGERPEADVIALGLLAGWEVDGTIRSGSFVSSFSPRGLDAGHWLTAALEMPIGRMTLFAPDIEQVALGPLLTRGPDGLGAVVTGYRFHHGSDHAADVNLLLSRVIDARRRMGLTPPLRLSEVGQAMGEELRLVHVGESDTSSALQAVMSRAVEQYGSNMRGLAIETTSLDALELPPELLRQRALHLDIGVTHHRPKGAAWAQYVILVVFADYSANEA
ncbi:hypothetical protein WME99_18045 [Sorangium sp. So ce136]|uniref:hypothetical protein n=1 Tax=Sorangium sp. So ce136 TaxID=3133284 RepID=UPI003F0C1867